jgi:hypothetical protein
VSLRKHGSLFKCLLQTRICIGEFFSLKLLSKMDHQILSGLNSLIEALHTNCFTLSRSSKLFLRMDLQIQEEQLYLTLTISHQVNLPKLRKIMKMMMRVYPSLKRTVHRLHRSQDLNKKTHNLEPNGLKNSLNKVDSSTLSRSL